MVLEIWLKSRFVCIRCAPDLSPSFFPHPLTPSKQFSLLPMIPFFLLLCLTPPSPPSVNPFLKALSFSSHSSSCSASHATVTLFNLQPSHPQTLPSPSPLPPLSLLSPPPFSHSRSINTAESLFHSFHSSSVHYMHSAWSCSGIAANSN